MKIALVQMEMTERVDENLEKTLRFMGEAAQNDASLVCFPEIQLSPFFPQHRDREVSRYVMKLSHPAVQSIREKCRELGLVAVSNLYLEQDGQRFDASPVIDANGSVLGVSKMVHIVQAPQFYERDYYTPSETGFQVYDTSVGKVGVVICFDRHFPESTRACALKGAELVVIPTANTKTEPLDIFEAEIRVAAYQNNMYIAMCNRVGLEDEMDFCGESLVVDPNGTLIAKANGREQILYAEILPILVRESRENRPYLRLRRQGIY